MKKVVIIGGGATGACVAINLYQQFKNKIDITIIDPTENLGLGRAYNTPDNENLLNVAAGNMGVMSDLPQHFTDWLSEYNFSESSFEFWPFVPRRIFGQYLQHYLKKINFKHIKLRVLDVKKIKDNYVLKMLDSSVVETEFLIIATGYQAENNIFEHLMPKKSTDRMYYPHELEMKTFATDEKILIIGSGLTAIDIWKRLRKFNLRKLTMISRHGFLPLPHLKYNDIQNFPIVSNLKPLAVLKLLLSFKETNKITWQQIADKVRLQSREIWTSWKANEKKQFIRCLKPYWEVIRHRLPESIYQLVKSDIDANKLRVMSGHILSIEKVDNCLKVVVKHKNTTSPTSYEFNYIVLATGSLINQNLFQLHEVSGVKLSTNQLGYVKIEAKNLWFAGPSSKAMYWESTAIPDIRVQAKEICLELEQLL